MWLQREKWKYDDWSVKDEQPTGSARADIAAALVMGTVL